METLPQIPPEVAPVTSHIVTQHEHSSLETPAKRSAMPFDREQALNTLFGVDREFAETSGLLDMFVYDPEHNIDGVVHTLSGEEVIDPEGRKYSSGFHHEPSSLDPKNTYVARAENESPKRTEVRAWESYKGRPVIYGIGKVSLIKNEETGKLDITEGVSDFFPREYDALAVLQSIRLARQNLDESKTRKSNDGKKIFTEGSAPLIDGKSQMRISMILDSESGKIITAHPKTPRKPVMEVTEQVLADYYNGT